jgi:hypothetical protein
VTALARGPLVAALLLRLLLPAAAIVFGGWSHFVTPDTITYLTPARHLLERGAFSNLSGPEIFRTPGYPLVLTLGLIAGQPIVVTLLLQALAGTLTVWFVMRAASLLFRDDARIVRTCGWLAACEPLALVCGALVMADTLLTTAISGAVLLVVMHFRQPHVRLATTRAAVALGATLAAAAYIKPIAYYLPVVLLPWLWFEQRRLTGRHLLSARHLLTAAATVVLLCGAWQIRNGVQTGFWGFSTLTARAVYVAAGGGVTAARDGRGFGEVREERMQQAGIRTPREPLHVGDMYRHGLSDVLASPGIAVAVHVKGMVLTLFDPATLDYLRLFGAYPATSPVTRYGSQGLAATVATIAREYPPVLWCSLLLEAVLLGYLALAARGAWRAAVLRGIPEARVLLLIAAYFLLLSGGIFGTARFRLPIMPVMILLAGYALSARPVGYTERA